MYNRTCVYENIYTGVQAIVIIMVNVQCGIPIIIVNCRKSQPAHMYIIDDRPNPQTR